MRTFYNFIAGVGRKLLNCARALWYAAEEETQRDEEEARWDEEQARLAEESYW